jgi:hypothetical protein
MAGLLLDDSPGAAEWFLGVEMRGVSGDVV